MQEGEEDVDKLYHQGAVQAVLLLKDFYSIAMKIEDADTFYTTEEIIRMIRDIRPDLMLSAPLVVLQLIEQGFRYEMITPGQIRWMLIAS